SQVEHSACTAGGACTKGSWQVLSSQSPVRAIHAALLKNGNVLLVAGSGNDPNQFAAGTFKSSVWNPTTGAFADVPTPADFFCTGHVQLSDGRLLVMGGNKAYPTADHGYEGIKSSYTFDPTTNQYVRVNDLNTGHWYPSATELGNGDVISLGGLDENGNGSVEVERFYNTAGSWNTPRPTQTYRFWGLYPSMILLQDGRLFYTGSHVFGNNVSDGPGANLYNVDSGQVTNVPGLRLKDQRDQSMSVLLPPAQAQRVATFGGGNIETNVDANNTTDLIDLSGANPTYVPGPNLLTGKMYVSAVILPDGKVFETGGGLHNRADPVYEASMYDPVANTFTPMATDPVPRTYHSSALLLPDGHVLAIGNNPGDGSFDMRVSIYTPAYLLNGVRPTITAAAAQWAYGSSQPVGTTSNVTIKSAQLIRPAAVTHSSDPNQRSVDLPITVNKNGQLTVSLTANPNIAPPGDYMLFVTDVNNIPSVARWVHVG
ncbi:galactose oxidase-like domain-containing protein, partial [Frankia sp. Cas3]|uniref:galactose oxidase-like domain-containing protein n=1 Tax=Frankia sp. Cas3 TaxID=3073926 RepID=UPI002AD398A7